MGICVVRNGEVVETRSWLVQPKENLYSYWNMQCHGIRPEDTEHSPSFPEVWKEIERLYLDEFDTFVAHNAPFDRSCLEHSAKLYHLHLPEINWQCSLKTADKCMISAVTRLVIFASNLAYLKEHITALAMMLRCAHGSFLRKIRILNRLL